MHKYIFLVVLIFFAFLVSAQAAVFNVSTPEEFQNALTQAQSNGEDDVINVQADMTITSTLFTFRTDNGDVGYNLTINGGGHSLNGGYSVEIMRIYAAGTVLIKDLVFEKGNGGLYVSTTKADVSIEGCNFKYNSASGNGGGAYVWTEEGTVTLTNNTFIGNSASGDGGGAVVKTYSGTITLTNNTFKYNSAGLDGGGAYVYTELDTATLTNNTFSSNSARLDGGGANVITGSGTATLTNNTFYNNFTSFYDGGGANVITGSGTLTLMNNSFNNNSTNYFGNGGGASVSAGSGTANLQGNTFYNNYNNYRGHGGGAYVGASSGTATLTNNTFYSNTSCVGGGLYGALYYDTATLNIYNNSFCNNSATANQGGVVNPFQGDDVYVDSDGNLFNTGSTVNLYNNNFSGNAVFDEAHDPYPGDKMLESEDLKITNTNRYSHGGNIQTCEEIPNQSPEIDSFTVEPSSGTAPLDVTVTCQATDPDGNIASYEFNPGDGSDPLTSEDGTFSYTYNASGSYNATCTAYDSDGASVTSDPVTVTVEEAGPSWNDISEGISYTRSRTLYDRINRAFFVLIDVTNNTGADIAGPVRMVLESSSLDLKSGCPGLEPDGYTDDGEPYFFIVPEGGTWAAGETMEDLRLNFVLQRKRLTFELRFEEYGQ